MIARAVTPATTATTTDAPKPSRADEFELLARLTELLLAWSFEGTLRSEAIVRRGRGCVWRRRRARGIALFTALAVGMLVAAPVPKAREVDGP